MFINNAYAQAAGAPVELSLSAGSFVCNQVFFGLQQRLRRQTGVRSGFIHVPALPEQAARAQPAVPSMGLAAQIEALRLAMAVALEADDRLAAGEVDEGAPTA